HKPVQIRRQGEEPIEMAMWKSDRRLFLTPDRKRVVEADDPEARTLLVGPNGYIPLEVAKQYGLADPDYIEPEVERVSEGIEESENRDDDVVTVSSTEDLRPIELLKRIGPSTVELLHEAGIYTFGHIKAMSTNDLRKIKGIGPKTAASLK